MCSKEHFEVLEYQILFANNLLHTSMNISTLTICFADIAIFYVYSKFISNLNI